MTTEMLITWFVERLNHKVSFPKTYKMARIDEVRIEPDYTIQETAQFWEIGISNDGDSIVVDLKGLQDNEICVSIYHYHGTDIHDALMGCYEYWQEKIEEVEE